MVDFDEDVIDRLLYEETRAWINIGSSDIEEDEDGFITNFRVKPLIGPKCTCGAEKLGYALDNFKAHYDWCEVHLVNRKPNDSSF